MLTSQGKVRELTAGDMGVSVSASRRRNVKTLEDFAADLSRQLEQNDVIGDDDLVWQRVSELLDDGYAGAILSGVPGTGKSWYARKIAERLTSGDASRQFYVQFHPNYQYEDFIQGFVPDGKGGFERVNKVFLQACEAAASQSVVLVIDELSRTDVVRVFGEVLTYLETSKRGLKFTLASGTDVSVPHNLVILATMNPWDRGVDELDLAFERRFARVKVAPDVNVFRDHLTKAGLPPEFVVKAVQFFHMVADHKYPLCCIGHAYFMHAGTVEAFRRVWDNQLLFHFEKVLRHDEEELTKLKAAWLRIFE